MRGGGPSRARDQSVSDAMGEHRRVVPLILFQGTADKTVAPINAQHLINQWSNISHRSTDDGRSGMLNLTSTTKYHPPDGYAYTQRIYEDPDRLVVIAAYLVDGMGHAWPGGSATGSFTDPAGPDASSLLLDFFLDHPKDGIRIPLYVKPLPIETEPAPAGPPPAQPPPPVRALPPTTPSRTPLWRHVGHLARALWKRIRQQQSDK
jgi:hypothetical protein